MLVHDAHVCRASNGGHAECFCVFVESVCHTADLEEESWHITISWISKTNLLQTDLIALRLTRFHVSTSEGDE